MHDSVKFIKIKEVGEKISLEHITRGEYIIYVDWKLIGLFK